MTSSSASTFSWLVLPFFLLSLSQALFAADTLPSPWQGTDVGAVGVAGSASETRDGDLLINGAGSDIWGTADSFHFVYQPLDDGEIDANAPAQDATNPFAKVGIMIRMSLDPGAPHVVLDVKPDGAVEFMTRSTPNGPTAYIAGSVANGTLKLVRSKGTVTAAVCAANSACRTIGTTPFPAGMALAGAVVTSHDASTLNHGRFPASPPSVYPATIDWRSSDVGDVGLAGDAFVENDTFTVRGAGADIWGTSDSYHAVSHWFNGDGDIVARVTSEDAANTFAKAGVEMFNGGKVILDIRPNGAIEFMSRSAAGSPMSFIGAGNASLPVWLKIQRRGETFAGLFSFDRRVWHAVGMTTVSMPSDISAGLAVTSHDIGALNTSTFDHVMASSQATFRVDIGDVGVAGEANYQSSGFTVQGGGADIWGTSDAFTYLYQAFINDGQMLVRVDSLDDTDAYAKAGIMIRESTDTDAAHVILDVRPDGSVEFMSRSTTGGSTSYLAGGFVVSFPVWLKLTRNGGAFTGFTSSDGSTWTQVGQTFPNMGGDAVVGLAVTSHRRAVLASASFAGLSR